jgi:hypothetical protein
MRPVLWHVTFEPAINVIRVVARNAARFLLVAQVLARHERLWTFDCFVFGAVLRRVFSATIVVGIAAVHASHTVSDRSPKQISTEVAAYGRRVGVFLESMRMRETVLMASKLSASDDVHGRSKRNSKSVKFDRKETKKLTCCACTVHAIEPVRC